MATRILLLFLACFASLAQITNVNIGTSANDNAGDSLRAAFSKLNTNTAWLASQLSSSTNSVSALSNLVGVVGQGTFNSAAFNTNATVAGADVATKVENVAALVALSPRQNGQLVSTLGYYIAGDGGGSDFVWNSSSTAATNTGTIFQRTAGGVGRFIWAETGRHNVRMYGAKGDVVGPNFNTSTNDSTSAFQACTDYAIANSLEVFVPFGNYVVNTWAIDGATINFEANQGYGYLGRWTAVWHRIVPAATDDLLTARVVTNGRFVVNNGVFIGRAENNRKTDSTSSAAISAASSSTFTISPSAAFTIHTNIARAGYDPTSAYPHYGFVEFFNSNTNVQRHIGWGLVQSINTNTGVCTLFPGFTGQWVGTAGSDLVGGSAVFSQLNEETANGVSTGYKPDPTRIGYNGLDRQGGLGGCTLNDCTFYGFNCGIRYGNGLDLYAQNLKIIGSKFAAFANAFPGYGSDAYFSGMTTLFGSYYRDSFYPVAGGGSASIPAETWVNSGGGVQEFRLCKFGIYGGSGSGEIQSAAIVYFINPLWLENCKQLVCHSITIDGMVRDNRLFGSGNRLQIGNLKIRGAMVNQGYQNISVLQYILVDGGRLNVENISFEDLNVGSTYTLGTGEVSGTFCRKVNAIQINSARAVTLSGQETTIAPGYTTARYGSGSFTMVRNLPDVTSTWILGALTASTPATTTVSVADARVGDKVEVAPAVLNGGTTIVRGVVTSSDTVTLYAIPIVSVATGQTNSMTVKVFAQ